MTSSLANPSARLPLWPQCEFHVTFITGLADRNTTRRVVKAYIAENARAISKMYGNHGFRVDEIALVRSIRTAVLSRN